MARTAQDLITDLRLDLDEFSEANWSDSTLLRFLERAVNKVATVLRFSRTGYLETIIDQDTSDFTVYGATYSPGTELSKAAGAKTLTLPENLVELRAVLPLSQTQRDNGVHFVLTTADAPEYRNARRITSASANRTYWCVITGLTTLRIAPPLGEATEFELHYAAMPERLASETAINSIPEYAYDAILAYAAYLGLKSIKSEDYPAAFENWKEEKRTAVEIASQRTSDEADVVHGVFDDEDFWEERYVEFS